MKKIAKLTLALVATLMVSVSSQAQTTKGSWMASGASNLGYSSGKQNSDAKDATSTLTFAPTVGYFVMDNLAIGLGIDMTSTKTGDVKEGSTTFGPLVRYYTAKKIYGQLSYGIGSMKSDDGTGSTTDKMTDLGLAVGYAWMLTDNISLDPSLAYHMTSYTPDGGDKVNGSNFGLNVGFTLLFGGK